MGKKLVFATASDKKQNKSQMVIYQAEDGTTKMTHIIHRSGGLVSGEYGGGNGRLRG
ncbi:hypothetical protein KAW50_06800 [candidate division WOR-3 bacterium]|nr:hypothetical protein [candidate division WOR-3 bacterium]